MILTSSIKFPDKMLTKIRTTKILVFNQTESRRQCPEIDRNEDGAQYWNKMSDPEAPQSRPKLRYSIKT